MICVMFTSYSPPCWPTHSTSTSCTSQSQHQHIYGTAMHDVFKKALQALLNRKASRRPSMQQFGELCDRLLAASTSVPPPSPATRNADLASTSVASRIPKLEEVPEIVTPLAIDAETIPETVVPETLDAQEASETVAYGTFAPEGGPGSVSSRTVVDEFAPEAAPIRTQDATHVSVDTFASEV